MMPVDIFSCGNSITLLTAEKTDKKSFMKRMMKPKNLSVKRK